MIQIFITQEAVEALVKTESVDRECTRRSYRIDQIDSPITFEITAGESGLIAESWFRDSSAAKMRSYAEKYEAAYGGAINSNQEGKIGVVNYYIGITILVNRYFERTAFWKDHTAPDPDKGGVLVTCDGGELSAKIVTGKARPDMKCLSSGDLARGIVREETGRPYKDELVDNVLIKIRIDNKEYQIGQGAVSSAVSSDVSSDESDFEIEEGVLTRYHGTGKDVVIPNGVTRIGTGTKMAFLGTPAESVKIPQSVTSIGGYAFYGCTGLSSINVPDSVTDIGHHAFRGCSSLKEITIPNGVETIERECFWGCTELKKVTLPENLKTIEEKAFSGCTSLSELVIPDGAVTIEDGAFWGDNHLKSIVIPQSVTHIGAMAFCDCSSLKILGSADSAAHTYAKENQIPFSVQIVEPKLDEEEKAKREDERRQYDMAYRRWQSECDKVQKRRKARIEELRNIEKTAVIAEAEKERDEVIARANATIREQAERKAAAEKTLASLGVFKISEKNRQKAVIEETAYITAAAQETIASAESACKSAVDDAIFTAKKKDDDFKKIAEKEFPFPEQPEKPAFIIEEEKRKREEKERIKREKEEERNRLISSPEFQNKRILEFLSDGGDYNQSEIMAGIPDFKSLSNQAISSRLSALVREGKIEKNQYAGRIYYKLV